MFPLPLLLGHECTKQCTKYLFAVNVIVVSQNTIMTEADTSEYIHMSWFLLSCWHLTTEWR